MVLQNPPTCRSCPHKQASIPEGTPFERDFICNNILTNLVYKNVSDLFKIGFTKV
jgi:hypothetical protein